ncbi:type IV pilus modification protein PilV [Undibacterium sp. Di24W]
MLVVNRKQAGTSLIEIMVSIVVIAIGLLGLASMQMNALKFQKTASQRSEAVQAAYDLSDRMRANFVYTLPELFAAERTANETKYTSTGTYATKKAGVYAPASNCTLAAPAAPCSTDQIATYDLAEWQRGLQRRLAGGAGYVIPVAGTAVSTFDVTVMWQEPTLNAVDASCPGAVAAPVGIRCFTIRLSV